MALFEKERIYKFINMQINVWLDVQIAYDNNQIKRALLDGIRNVVALTIRRYPNAKPAMRKWLVNFPEAKDWEIFSGLQE